MIKRLIQKFFDYKIVGEYYDSYFDKTKGIHVMKKKYIKKYRLKKRR